MNNIIICQEMKHTLKHSQGQKGGMIIKIDLEKAYDRLEWGFIVEDARLPVKIVEVIYI